MRSVWGKIRLRLLGLRKEAAERPLRASGAAEEVRAAQERILEAFVSGYNAAVATDDLAPLARELGQVPPTWRGFAFEGAGMSLWLQDSLSLFRRDRWKGFQFEHAPEHAYLLHVGAGWAMAHLRQSWSRRSRRMDPLLRWLALDGFGFRQGLFRAHRYHVLRAEPGLPAPAASVFDQGLGRSLWFVCGAARERIRSAIEGFAPGRRNDLWSGVGLASAYAGGISGAEVEELFLAAGTAAPHFAQGAAFAVAARARGRNPAEHTDELARRIWRESPEELAERVESARARAARSAREDGYATWRASLCEQFVARQRGHRVAAS